MGLFGFKRAVDKPVELPAHEPELKVMPPVAQPSRRRMFLVNVDPAAQGATKQLIQSLGARWDVVVTASDAQALELADQNPPAGVIYDLTRGDQDSKGFFRSLAACAPKSLRFLRGGQQEGVMAQNLQGLTVQFLPSTLDSEGFSEAVMRAFRMSQWMGNGDVRELLGKMKRLPSLPTLYTQVLSELAKPEGSLNFVGRLIAKEPAMTAKMLQCVNSAAFGLRREISDPAEAVLQLGAERTKALILAASAFQELNQVTCRGFSHEKLWQHSMAVGWHARIISNSQKKDARMADQAFTAGLLHDLGKLLLASNLGETYGDIIDQAAHRHVEVRVVERDALGTTHAELGACFLAVWGLPIELLEAVAWHHVPIESDDTGFTVLSALHVANAIDIEAHAPLADALVSLMDSAYVTQIGLAGSQNRWRELCGRPAKIGDGGNRSGNRV